ncbi:hypothetical protein G3T14_19535 [Methylobacterium sp. BTF04]|uniref:hypothetical protein n=1 Tax=Methylobacterium sp. BTF04 TaxID=2708300 RepID=UPI0013D3FF17|nr:hypothetical protein [Methylobacterium sp. BTF04]NEU14303.1 hypothetical protein [Methylobacterium sp. BTF04]
MHGRTADQPLIEAEQIARAYAAAARNDPWAALVQVIADALADMDEAERRSEQRDRLISRGYARSAPPTGDHR